MVPLICGVIESKTMPADEEKGKHTGRVNGGVPLLRGFSKNNGESTMRLAISKVRRHKG